MRCLAAVLVLGAAAASAAEGRIAEPAYLDVARVPERVSRLADCDAGTSVARWPFSDFVLFAFRCPGNNHNYVQSFVRAADADGRAAALVVFPPTPYSEGRPLTELSNARILADSGSIGEILVDDERAPGTACRYETLFRFDRLAPRMVFHRQSSTCEARPGQAWTVVLDERTPAERQEDWERN